MLRGDYIAIVGALRDKELRDIQDYVDVYRKRCRVVLDAERPNSRRPSPARSDGETRLAHAKEKAHVKPSAMPHQQRHVNPSNQVPNHKVISRQQSPTRRGVSPAPSDVIEEISTARKQRTLEAHLRELTFHPSTTAKAKAIPSTSPWHERLHTEEVRKRDFSFSQKMFEKEMLAKKQEEEDSREVALLHTKGPKVNPVVFQKLYVSGRTHDRWVREEQKRQEELLQAANQQRAIQLARRSPSRQSNEARRDVFEELYQDAKKKETNTAEGDIKARHVDSPTISIRRRGASISPVRREQIHERLFQEAQERRLVLEGVQEVKQSQEVHGLFQPNLPLARKESSRPCSAPRAGSAPRTQQDPSPRRTESFREIFRRSASPKESSREQTSTHCTTSGANSVLDGGAHSPELLGRATAAYVAEAPPNLARTTAAVDIGVNASTEAPLRSDAETDESSARRRRKELAPEELAALRQRKREEKEKRELEEEAELALLQQRLRQESDTAAQPRVIAAAVVVSPVSPPAEETARPAVTTPVASRAKQLASPISHSLDISAQSTPIHSAGRDLISPKKATSNLPSDATKRRETGGKPRLPLKTPTEEHRQSPPPGTGSAARVPLVHTTKRQEERKPETEDPWVSSPKKVDHEYNPYREPSLDQRSSVDPPSSGDRRRNSARHRSNTDVKHEELVKRRESRMKLLDSVKLLDSSGSSD